MEKLFTPFQVGDTNLANRVVMAPMTRSRAISDDTPDELTAKYYQQRASAGLIITEGSQISVQGTGLSFHSRNLQRCSGAGMGKSYKSGPRRWRKNLYSTLARRANFSHKFAG